MTHPFPTRRSSDLEMTGAVADDAAFGEGVADAGRDDLLGALFGVRAASVLGLRAAGTAASYVSGLLIGTDVRAHVRPGETVYLLADETLGGLYARDRKSTRLNSSH